MQNFDEIAATYDFLNHLLSANWDRRWRKQAVHVMNITPQAKILDVCTGTADIALAIAAQHPTVQVVGVDLAEAMLNVGRSKIARQHPGRQIALIQANALQLPFADQSFDVGSMGFGLRNLTERANGLREMARVLKKNGQLVLLEFAPPPQSWFGKLYQVYLRRVIPLLGGLVSRSTAAYQYLADSIERFPEPAVIANLLQDSGFRAISRQKLLFGIVYLYVASKQASVLSTFDCRVAPSVETRRSASLHSFYQK